jgi:hypothetical protein
VAAAVKAREIARRLGVVVSALGVFVGSVGLLNVTSALLYLPGGGHGELWIAEGLAAGIVLVSLWAYRRLDVESRHFMLPMAAMPVSMIATSLVLQLLPVALQKAAVAGLCAMLLGLTVLGVLRYRQARRAGAAT